MPEQPPEEPDGTAHEQVREIVRELEDRARKMGLYLEDVGIASQSHDQAVNAMQSADKLREVINSGEAQLVVVGTFVVGDVALSKRVLDPEQDEIDTQVRAILPDPAEELREKMRRAAEDGKSIFDLDEGDESG